MKKIHLLILVSPASHYDFLFFPVSLFFWETFFFWWDQSHYLCIFFAAKNSLGFLILPIPSMYGIFTYFYHKNQPNVGKYASPMDPVGYYLTHFWGSLQLFLEKKKHNADPRHFLIPGWQLSCRSSWVGDVGTVWCVLGWISNVLR